MSDRRRNSITWVKPPQPTRHPRGRLGPCDSCKVGDHQLCTKVGCYNCPPVNHPRHHAAGNGERATRGLIFAGATSLTRVRSEVSHEA